MKKFIIGGFFMEMHQDEEKYGEGVLPA